MKKSGTRSWTTPEEITKRLRRRWERGDFLANTLPGEETLFPLRIPIRGPSSAEITAEFAAVREWAAKWHGQTGICCEKKRLTHRVFGSNEIPAAAIFPDAGALVQWLNVSGDWKRFHKIVRETEALFPELLPWLRRRPVNALGLAGEWGRILSVVAWLRDHPQSGKYLRQIDIPGVHTKFIETHRQTISELLDHLSLTGGKETDFRGISGFNRRCGLRDKPERIRLRFLDRSCAVMPDRIGLDLTLDASAFARLDPPVTTVFITENEINYLAFPDRPRSLLLFGSGYGWSALDGADWLRHCAIHYWGDIDTHGFAILDQLRAHLAHAQSFLMDLATLETLQESWGLESTPVKRPLPRLTEEERTVFDRLRSTGQSAALRLEQERVPFSMIEAALRSLK